MSSGRRSSRWSNSSLGRRALADGPVVGLRRCRIAEIKSPIAAASVLLVSVLSQARRQDLRIPRRGLSWNQGTAPIRHSTARLNRLARHARHQKPRPTRTGRHARAPDRLGRRVATFPTASKPKRMDLPSEVAVVGEFVPAAAPESILPRLPGTTEPAPGRHHRGNHCSHVLDGKFAPWARRSRSALAVAA